MRWLIWWIRSCFCKHDFEYSEVDYTYIVHHFSGRTSETHNVKVSATCTECGWHRKYYKFPQAKF